RTGDMLVVETALDTAPQALAGVLRIDERTGLSLSAAPGPVPPAGQPVAAAAAAAGEGGELSIWAALGGALLGGLLLNVMPCVFPILSLKALGLARAGVDEATARREALAYTAGVIVTCLALGGLLLALRAGGAALGWAFQLQDPRVIALLLLLVTAIALNLAGVFELRTIGAGDALAHKGGAVGAFWTGALAAFVATPCTGPFMAAALGAALVLPPAIALVIFGGLGLGLALPFLAIGFVPALRRLLPRPGAWMDTMRHILSVPMFLTALGLAWILGRQAGVNGMAIGLGAALLLGFGLWWAGARQAKGRGFAPALPAFGVAVVLALTLAPVATSAEAKTGRLGAKPFTQAALSEAQASGAPVFVYFTADWCITCKVNEKAAIDRDEVASAFARAGVKVLVGDWTRGDPVIGRFLAAHGRSGVPLYLFYRPGRSEPEVLPQLLTPAILTKLVG
ncbi:MAG TPA: thioredoxin family protein, partial [Solirubrobacterales bacterium]|nr:thioredoxin family protein [Solirubrobacterales bacterium]